jgi:diguanylate cyclase (GGDEF)-like protein/PAS domain S-box-containing protein
LAATQYHVPAAGKVETHPDWEPESAHRRQWVSMYRVGRTALLFGLALAFAAVFLFLPLVDTTTAFSWLAIYVAVTVVRLYYTREFLRKLSDIRDPQPWKHGFVLGVAASGLLWGMTSFVYEIGWPGPYQVYVFLIYAGLISVAAIAYSASLQAFAVYASLVLGPPFIKLGLGDFPGSSLFALFILLYGIVMFFIARTVHKSIRSLTGLELANIDLREYLAEIHEDLDLEIEQRSVLEKALWRERKLFLDGPVVVFRWRNESGWPIEYVSPNVRQFHLDPEELRTRNVPYGQFIHPEDLSLVSKVAPIEGMDAKHPALTKDYRLRLSNGEIRWVYDHTVPIYDAEDKVTHYDGYILDITDRKVAERTVLAEKERIQTTLRSIGDGVITTDRNHSITYLNPAAEALTGVRLEQARNRKLQDVFRIVDTKKNCPIQDILADGAEATPQHQRSVRLISATGASHEVTYTLSPIRDYAGDRIGLVVIFHDASESIAMSRELAYQAAHDSLTGTLNRREFESRLENALATARQDLVLHSLIYIDLDQFKVINDAYGHRAGDRLLLQVADGLARIVGERDDLARLGGDEFAVLVYGCSANRARTIASKLKTCIQSIRYQCEDRVFRISASIGIAEINNKSLNVEQVLSAADMACYAAKDRGRNRIQIYRESDVEIKQRQTDMEWVSRIQSALDNNRLMLFYQSIEPVSLPRGPVVRQEILVRLIDDTGELIPASVFLPAAERFNLAPAVDRWVVRESIKSIQGLQDGTDKVYFINVSGTSLGQQDFLRYIKAQFYEFGVAGSQICFEITETAAISNLRHAIDFVGELKSMGCHFALDDFGSGLSSFAYLKELSVDYLKIDGVFIQKIVNDTLDHALVEAINQVGHVLLIDTVAEHVESAFVFEEIKKIGIDYAQGNYIQAAEPLPGQPAKLEKLNASQARNRG